MSPRTRQELDRSASGPLFLPLAFRLGASFGLLVLHAALPPDTPQPNEGFYLGFLALVFLEGVWEAMRNQELAGDPFAAPSTPWIRWNLLLDLSLVLLLIAFQGVNQERFSTFYVLPVLASAFYLPTLEIVGVAALSAAAHIILVLGFDAGWLPAFGRTVPGLGADAPDKLTILSVATLQIFAATLVVVLLRRNLEALRTYLRASEAEVGELSALHRRVVESLFSGLITLDLRYFVTSANPAAEGILHRPVYAGLHLSELFPDPLAVEEAIAEAGRFEVEMRVRQEMRILGGQVAPLRDAGGRPSGHLLLFQDLTEFKTMEERTRTSERLAVVGQLSAGLAHELRNPLASIMGCVQLLADERQTPVLQKRLIGILARESDRVNAIVTDFLDFARPGELRAEPCYLPLLLDDLQASWETDTRAQGLALKMDAAPEVFILTDRVSFHRMGTNLLSNARKAVRGVARPEVRLHLEAGGDWLRLTVEDNGCGMDAERLRNLFVPFSSGFEEGTGLGLSLVYQFVETMGWDIRVESHPGTGTRVQLLMPLVSESFSGDPA